MSGVWTILAVGVGGAIGALLRGLAEWAAPTAGLATWLVILVVNLIGCGLMGFMSVWLACRLRRDGTTRLAAHPRSHLLADLPGMLTDDPTLPAAEIARFNRRLRIESGLLMTGLLGGFTTFSSFSLDVVHLVQTRAFFEAGINMAVSIGGGVIAVLIGLEAGLRFFGRRRGQTP